VVVENVLERSGYAEQIAAAAVDQPFGWEKGGKLVLVRSDSTPRPLNTYVYQCFHSCTK
jgi:hypothetical protein